MNMIKDGVFPTMITPFNKDLTIDYKGLDQLVQWYVERGVDGLFAVAQSSAMFELSLKERVALARRTRELAPKDLPVVASGHISDTIEDQVEELNEIAETGVDTLVLLSNRFAAPLDNDDIWKLNIEKLLDRLPSDISLGLYECPVPYKKIISDELLLWLIDTNRFTFIKDTCCDPARIKRRGAIAEGTAMKLFNANAPTLLMSLKNGYAGYSGIMTNFHTDLYYWLCHNWKTETEKAEKLQNYLSVSSLIEEFGYPINAKYALSRSGVEMELVCRRSDVRYRGFSEYDRFLVDHFLKLSEIFSREVL